MKNFLFKFALLYFILILDFAPFSWLGSMPGIGLLNEYYFQSEAFLVQLFNTYFFHIADQLNFDGAGSGDTSYAWARFYSIIIISLLVSFCWNIADKKHQGNDRLAYALRNGLRYYIALVAFSYGIIKVFALQMPFPSLSQLATPLGDFLPMRLSWMFLGYSKIYQTFSGVMEILVCLLLFNRKTITAGLILGLAVFSNVFILNLSYDIPVKLYSFQLLVACLYLVAEDGKRLIFLFGFNSEVGKNVLYENHFSFRFYKAIRIVFKTIFLILFMILPTREAFNWSNRVAESGSNLPFYTGQYLIDSYVLNGDTVLISASDNKLWHDLILDKGQTGSIQTTDSLFVNRYGRGYFIYKMDSNIQRISFTKSASDSTILFSLNCSFSDSSALHLWGNVRSDSVDYRFVKSNRHFQLTERQFHWISESNR